MPNPIQPGDEFQNRYQVVEAIGSGGMGEVYLAQDRRLDVLAALKMARATSEEELAAFAREARLLANLRHAALPRVTDFFDDNGRQFIVMDFVAGKDLKKLLALRARPFACTKILDWADQILDALSYLHTQPTPVIHRDIKPSNLKLTPEGRIVLLDFGLAKGRAGQMSAEQALASLRRQTLPYAPPEQSVGGTDQRSDLFSLCATLYHLLTNELAPYAEGRVWEVRRRPDPLQMASVLNNDVPVAVAKVIHGGMALEPDERPQSADEMRQALRAASNP